jgi:hypothetical protein
MNLVSQGILAKAGSVPFDPLWYKSYQSFANDPAVVLDFVGGRYWDGTNNKAAINTLISGVTPTIDGTGLLLNSAAMVAAGALLAAMKVAAFTICVEVSGGTAATNAGIISFTVADAPVFQVSTNVARNFHTGLSLDTAQTAVWTGTNRVGSSRDGAGRAIGLNAQTPASDTTVIPLPTVVSIGSYNGGSIFGGRLRALYILPFRPTAGQMGYTSVAPAWTGANALFCSGTNFVTLGNVLQYEATQPWTFGCMISGLKILNATANVIATNVTTSPAFPGIDFMWVGGSNNSPVGSAGRIFVRLINDIVAPHYIGVFGTTRIDDGRTYYVWATNDGSGTAAGVKLYVFDQNGNGGLETLNIESDTLAGNSVVAAGQELYIGNQKNHTDFPANCVVDAIRMSNIVRSPSYIAAHSTPATVAAIDANTVLALDFDEGTGLTSVDKSASGFNATLLNTGMWARGFT